MANAELIQKAKAIRSWALDSRLIAAGPPEQDVDAGEKQMVAQAFGADLPTSWQKSGLTGVGVSDTRERIIVYTAARMPKTEQKRMPSQFSDGVEILYKRASPFTLKDDTPDVVIGAKPGKFLRKRYTCGSSISIANRRSAGTMGALVRNEEGTLLGLTNNHVTGGCNNTRRGMPVSAPGIKDVSSTGFRPFTLGSHHTSIPIVLGEPDTVDHLRNTDAAVFEILSDNSVSSMQQGFYDTPIALAEILADPEDGLLVKKVGRTTGQTFGRIESQMIGAFPLDYDIPTYHSAIESVRFSGRVYFEPVYLVRGIQGVFSDRGDSGALVVTDVPAGQEKAVGLIFAGDASDNLSYILPIHPILDTLGLTLVSGMGTND
ncbi:hypothetical protein FMN63_11435 [Stappia sp. BW2]|uniref:hypothetical protein n=1 Tax=Stappia sp. BW2 TaxID=2592622 RepID=UPI0011DEC605|nr:hypothetical protein [Stappia sp. BW2]TYC68288.1 hypothetical protein FMN63_11435 [Stappia sp. BW2]